jgi:hypothetical protein
VKGRNDKEAETSGPLSSSHKSVNVISPAKDLVSSLPFSTHEVPFNIAVPLNTSFSIPSRFVPSALHKSYMATYLHANISSLALQSRTFFIHHSTLTPPIPSPLQSALSVSALAILSSPSTFSILDSHLRTLIATSPQTFYSPLSILHSVQALIIYQLIRLFSSNSTAQQKFHAETSFPLLNKWTIALQTAYFELPPATTTLQEWIVKESIRRTILTSVFLRSYYCSERDGYTALVPLLASLPVTKKGWIWEMGMEEWGEDLGVSVEDEVGTYWEFIVARCKYGIGGGMKMGKGKFERLLLCLEEDGEVGEAALELVDSVKATGCGKGEGESIRSWLRELEW